MSIGEERYRQTRRNAISAFVASSTVAWGIWVFTSFTDHGFDPYVPWPLLIMLGSGWHLVQVIRLRRGIIEVQERRGPLRRRRRR